MEQLTLFQEGSHANPIQRQENDLEKQMTDTSGRKCLERFERLPRPGLWAKTYAALLIGMEGWYSTKCRLTWKLVGTKSNRFFFQLAPSTLPTEGIGFGLLPTPKATEIEENYDDWKARMKASGNPKNVGKTTANIGTMAVSGLLPTPTVMDTNQGDLDKIDQRRIRAKQTSKNGNGFGITIGELANRGLLPTPISSEIHHAERVKKLKESGAETMASRKLGASRPNGLMDFLDFNQMLPTPTTRDANGIEHSPSQKNKSRLAPDIATMYEQTHGKTSQLNPRFVLEMMGFPPDWTELPFQSGETNQSKQQETP